jgi:hypothetical protein
MKDHSLSIRAKHQLRPGEQVVAGRGPRDISRIISFLRDPTVDWEEAQMPSKLREENIDIIQRMLEKVARIFQEGGVLTVGGILAELSEINPSERLLENLGQHGALFDRIRDLRRMYGMSTDLTMFHPATYAYVFGHNAFQLIALDSTTVGGEPRYGLNVPGREMLSLYEARTGLMQFAESTFKEAKLVNCVGTGTIANAMLHTMMEGKR